MTEYMLNTDVDLGREQVRCLEELLDRRTVETLKATGIRLGHRCLELGAGGGSISRWPANEAAREKVALADLRALAGRRSAS